MECKHENIKIELYTARDRNSRGAIDMTYNFFDATTCDSFREAANVVESGATFCPDCGLETARHWRLPPMDTDEKVIFYSPTAN